MTHYYSEPYKTSKKEQTPENKKKNSLVSNWAVDKIATESKQKLATIPFHTEKLAWDFLKEIKISVEGQLCYTGQ